MIGVVDAKLVDLSCPTGTEAFPTSVADALDGNMGTTPQLEPMMSAWKGINRGRLGTIGIVLPILLAHLKVSPLFLQPSQCDTATFRRPRTLWTVTGGPTAPRQRPAPVFGPHSELQRTIGRHLEPRGPRACLRILSAFSEGIWTLQTYIQSIVHL